MKTDRVVRLLLAISHLASAAVLSKVSQDKVVNVRVSRVVPRHQCRRALRNLEVRAILYEDRNYYSLINNYDPQHKLLFF